MPQNQSLQTQFLQHLQTEKMPVAIFLVNGIKLQGFIAGFDNEIVVLQNTLTQLVFKHAISTIVPTNPIEYSHIISKQEVSSAAES